MSRYLGHQFQQNDIDLLHSGNFADGIVKCHGRTWKVHCALLASRLKFFKAAFYGSFAEAASGEIDFPEADPDSVDIMLRHLYREYMDVRELVTPLLCVRCWILADYVQLDTLKLVAISSLEDHLDAMALLASNDQDLEVTKPKWLQYFLDALREVSVKTVAKPLQTIFVAFLWVTRFHTICLPPTLQILTNDSGMNEKLLELLIRNKFQDIPNWIPNFTHNEHDIRVRKEVTSFDQKVCSRCFEFFKLGEPKFYNPFPVTYPKLSTRRIGELIWCKACVDDLNESRNWPWRPDGWGSNGWGSSAWGSKKCKLEAWSWDEDE